MENLEKTFHKFVVVGVNEQADSDQNGKIEIKAKFDFPRLLKVHQSLFLSDDYTKLLEIQIDEVNIYTLDPIDTGSTITKANFKSRVARMPKGILDNDFY